MLLDWLQPLTLKQYRHYRDICTGLNTKIIKACVTGEVLDAAARRLDMNGRGRTLVFESEEEMSVLMDFAIYEVRQQGKNLVHHFGTTAEARELCAEELQLIEAMRQARSGLFRVERADRRNARLELRSLVSAQQTLEITDYNFSRAPVEGRLMFTRAIGLAGFSMTSGAVFVFDASMEAKLVRQWDHCANSADRFARFFQLSRHTGVPVVYK